MKLKHQAYLGVSQAARKLRVQPREITNALYERCFGDKTDILCPLCGNRRMIPESVLGRLKRMIQKRRAKRR